MLEGVMLTKEEISDLFFNFSSDGNIEQSEGFLNLCPSIRNAGITASDLMLDWSDRV